MSKDPEDFLIANPEDLERWGYNLADFKALAATVNAEGYTSRFTPAGTAIIGRVPGLSVRDNEIKFYCDEHGQQVVTGYQLREELRREMWSGITRKYSGLYRPPINPWSL